MRPSDLAALKRTKIDSLNLELNKYSDRIDADTRRNLVTLYANEIQCIERVGDPVNRIHEIFVEFRKQLETFKPSVRKATGVPHPGNMKVRLYPHQLVAIYEMELLEKNKGRVYNSTYVRTCIGVLGDSVGSGKTYEILAHVIRDRMPFGEERSNGLGPNNKGGNKTLIFVERRINHVNTVGNIMFEQNIEYIALNTTLVTCSPSIIKQWEDSLRNTGLKWLTLSSESAFARVKVTDYDVVLISTLLVNQLIQYYNEHAWKRFVYDEVDSARISGMVRVVAGFTWLVSATSNMIERENSHLRYIHYLKSLFTSAMGNYDTHTLLQYIMVKTPDELINKSKNLPSYKTTRIVCQNMEYAELLNGLVDDRIMNMLNAGDPEGAIASMGGKVENGDNLMTIVKARAEHELDTAIKWKQHHEEEGHEKKVEEWETKVAKCREKIKHIEERFSEALEKDCPICYADKMAAPAMVPCCYKIQCAACILGWMQNKNNVGCPHCRKPLNAKTIHYFSDTKVDDTVEIKDGHIEVKQTKTEVVLDYLTNERKCLVDGKMAKFIVFSEFSETFDVIKRELQERKIDFSELNGVRGSRERDIERYKSGNLNVLLLQSRTNGSGLNLQNTQRIILAHRMDSSLKAQMIGRAYRIGYKGGLEVIEVLYENEVA